MNGSNDRGHYNTSTGSFTNEDELLVNRESGEGHSECICGHHDDESTVRGFVFVYSLSLGEGGWWIRHLLPLFVLVRHSSHMEEGRVESVMGKGGGARCRLTSKKDRESAAAARAPL
jgi:hypothetical protein